MPEITDAYLAEIEARLNAATPGPWEYFEHSNLLLAENAELVIGDGGCDVGPAHTEDGHLIAHAPADLAALLAEVRRLRARYESTPKTPDVPNTWLTVNGKDYACKCGCALFNQPNRNISTYYCNKCGAEHEGMPV